MAVGSVLSLKDTKEPHEEKEVGPPHPQQAGHAVHEGDSGAARDAGATGNDSRHPQLRKPAIHTVTVRACVSEIQGRDQRSGSNVTSLSNTHPPPPGPLSQGHAVPGQEDWSWE